MYWPCFSAYEVGLERTSDAGHHNPFEQCTWQFRLGSHMCGSGTLAK